MYTSRKTQKAPEIRGFFVGSQNENLRISTPCVQLLRRILRRPFGSQGFPVHA